MLKSAPMSNKLPGGMNKWKREKSRQRTVGNQITFQRNSRKSPGENTTTANRREWPGSNSTISRRRRKRARRARRGESRNEF